MRTLWIPLALLPLALLFAPTAAADAEGHVNFFLGQKSLDSDDWGPVDQQGELGAVMAFGAADWPILIAADVLNSGQQKDVSSGPFGPSRLKVGMFEAAVGARKIWKVGKARPYVGGGIAVIGDSVEYDMRFFDVDADDTAVGPSGDGGVF